MTVFGNPRGTFSIAEISASGAPGVVVSIPGGLKSSTSEVDIVTSFSVAQAELVGIQQCLNKAVYAYTFGHDPSQSRFSVGITRFMQKCPQGFRNLSAHVGAYSSGRISEAKGQTVSLSVGGTAFKGHLVGQLIEVASAELNLVNVTYSCLMLKAAK